MKIRQSTTHILLAMSVVLLVTGCGSPSPSQATSSRAASPGPAWESSLEAGLRRAKGEEKLVMVFFYTEWCGWCRRMDQSTFADDRVRQALSRVVAVRLDAEKNGRAEAARFRVNSFPVTAFLDSTGAQVARIPGFLPAPAFLEELQDVLAAAAAKR